MEWPRLGRVHEVHLMGEGYWKVMSAKDVANTQKALGPIRLVKAFPQDQGEIISG